MAVLVGMRSIVVRRTMASAAVWESTAERPATKVAGPWIIGLLLVAAVVLVVVAIASKEWVGRALTLEVGDEVPEGSRLIVVAH